MRLLDRLAELGVELPQPAAPVASYVAAAYGAPAYFGQPQTVLTSGQLPLQDGKLLATGKVADAPGVGEVSVSEAASCARQCALNALAAAAALVDDPNQIVGVVRVRGFVASAEGFTGQAAVLNGASDFYGEIFTGDFDGVALELPAPSAHVRSAVGVAELPLNTPVEVEVEFLLDRR